MPLNSDIYSLLLKKKDTFSTSDKFWLNNLVNNNSFNPLFRKHFKNPEAIFYLCYFKGIIVGACIFVPTPTIKVKYDGIISIAVLTSHKNHNTFIYSLLEEFLDKLDEYQEAIGNLFVSHEVKVEDSIIAKRYFKLFIDHGLTIYDFNSSLPITGSSINYLKHKLIKALKDSLKIASGKTKQQIRYALSYLSSIDEKEFLEIQEKNLWEKKNLPVDLIKSFLRYGKIPKKGSTVTYFDYRKIDIIKLTNYVIRLLGGYNSCVVDKNFYTTDKFKSLTFYVPSNNFSTDVKLLKKSRRLITIFEERLTKHVFNLIIKTGLIKTSKKNPYQSAFTIQIVSLPKRSFTVNSIYHTSSKVLWLLLKQRAEHLKMRLSLKGLLEDGEIVELHTTQELFEKLELVYIPLKKRINFRGKIETIEDKEKKEWEYNDSEESKLFSKALELNSRFLKVIKISDRPLTEVFINPSFAELHKIQRHSPKKEVYFIADGRTKNIYVWAGGYLRPDKLWFYLKSEKLFPYNPNYLIGIGKDTIVTFTNIEEIRKRHSYYKAFLQTDWSFINKFFKFNNYAHTEGIRFKNFNG